MRSIYLDNNATTAIDDRILVAMERWLRHTGNAASAHHDGRRAAEAISAARAQVAAHLGTAPRNIVFTSGATEANNLALKGLVDPSGVRHRMVTAATEHPSVDAPLRSLARAGYELVIVPVDSDGIVDLDALAAAVDEHTLVVSIMAANNETGVLTTVPDVSRIARAAGAFVHTDATQLAAWGALDVDEMDVDLLSLSAHKMHGPQGVGALYVRRGTNLEALLHGGGHEHGLRSGTSNTAGIVGFGVAAALASAEGPAAAARVSALRDDLADRLAEQAGPVSLNGHPERRLPGTLNLAFPGADADAVMAGAPSVALATGSACSSGHPGPSRVLAAMGVTDEIAGSSLRFGLSRMTTADDVALAADLVGDSVRRARARASSQMVAS